MNTKLIAQSLNEDFYVPKTGKHFSHLDLENELSPETTAGVVKFVVENTLGALQQVAQQNNIDPEEFTMYLMPEIVKELNGFSPHKQIGF